MFPGPDLGLGKHGRAVPCIAFAVSRERQPFIRACQPAKQIRGMPCASWVCQSKTGFCLILQTGIGLEAAGKALNRLLEQSFRPSYVVAAGFAAGLRLGLAVGDVILATEVINSTSSILPTAVVPSGGQPWKKGRMLTMPHLVGDPRDKLRLASEFEADAIDMESAAIGQACARHEVPFYCIRAISDDCNTLLPLALAEVLPGGRVNPIALAKALARRPSLIRHLFRLAADTRLAARNLAVGLTGLLDRLQGRFLSRQLR
jgi:nucleoside phosphorylase